ncbi:MAG: LD-carboxypeptidase [Kiritimatiellae bacterium]|nr:LD-carboxypeptidase [Kiritimatiellia bacterium]
MKLIGRLMCIIAATQFAVGTTAAESKRPDLTGMYGPDVKTIGVSLISSVVPEAKFMEISNRLVRAGYRLKVAPNVLESKVASVDRRKQLLEDMWMDPEVDLLVFARGGQGAVDVVEKLDWEKLKKRDMRVIGFSDLTMLVNSMLAKGVGHPMTGPVLTTLCYSNQAAVNRMRDMMNGCPKDMRLRVVKGGDKPVEGLAMGGLLDRLHRLTLKGWLPDATGRVIFIENTNKYASRTDEMLGCMLEKGVFEKAAAVVICDFNSKQPKEATRKKLEEFSAKIPCPVFSGFPYGHVPNTSIIDFRRKLTISPDGTLSWAQGNGHLSK